MYQRRGHELIHFFLLLFSKGEWGGRRDWWVAPPPPSALSPSKVVNFVLEAVT